MLYLREGWRNEDRTIFGQFSREAAKLTFMSGGSGWG